MESLAEPYRRNKAIVGRQNRKNGEAFEFRILRKEKRNSIFAIRSAGSHSLIDLISNKKNGEIWYISAKSNGYHTPKEREDLKKLKNKLPANIIIKLAYYITPKKFKYETM